VSADSLPDYYAILQVHPGAEQEVIEAAYRSLMRKYHPDALPLEQRDHPDILARVRSINIAYDILSNPDLRQAYDAQFLQPQILPGVTSAPGLETAILLVRCARSRRTYRMLLARRNGTDDLFQVTGFEPADPAGHPELSAGQVANLPALPPPSNPLSPVQRFLDRFRKKAVEPDRPPATAPKFPSQNNLEAMFFRKNNAIHFGQIVWSHHTDLCRMYLWRFAIEHLFRFLK
jgi:hypothetical protein